MAGRRLAVAGAAVAALAGTIAAPASGAAPRWHVTASMPVSRFAALSVGLADGRVLVIGGYKRSGPLASATIFDPKTGTWSGTKPLHQARSFGAATLLHDGRVLVVGGDVEGDCATALDEAEVYDPATNTWTVT